MTGALSDECVAFDDLPAALSFVRADARAAEADIELWVEGLYIFVHQAKGWSHQICGKPRRRERDQPNPALASQSPTRKRGLPWHS